MPLNVPSIALFLFCTTQAAQAQEVSLPSAGVVPEAEALVSELGCLNCHQVQGPLAERFSPRRAPLLERVGARRSAESLRRYISAPHTSRPGTSMPDMLAGLPSSDRAEALENLVHYLASRAGPLKVEAFQASEFMLENGRQLLHSIGCVACHIPEESLQSLDEAFVPGSDQASMSSAADDDQRYVMPGTLDSPQVSFGDLAARTHVDALAEFLLDPLEARPSGRMPSMGLAADEARDIAVYLLREQCASSGYAESPGMRYAYYEHNFGNGEIEFDGLEPKRVGVLNDEFGGIQGPEASAAFEHRADHFAFEFSGTLKLASAGSYGFRSASDDGSWLYIDGELVVDNAGSHAVISKSGSIELKAGAHTLRIVYFEGGGGSDLFVYWSPPGQQERPLRGDDLVSRTLPMQPLDAEEFVPDPARVSLGLDLFAKLGCAACHEAPTASAPAFGDCDPEANSGCLSSKPTAGSPSYGWSDQQREAVRSQLSNFGQLAAPTPVERVNALMAQNRCYACHRRDDVGGPHPSRGDYFASQPGVDLGEQGRIPPILNSTGSKLNRDWLHSVLQEGATARPALLTRMPQFNKENMQDLEAALVLADAELDPATPHALTTESRQAGRLLAGTKGLGCIQCHTFNGHASVGVQAADLAGIKQRIQYPWFRKLLQDPDSIGMNSRMPEFWTSAGKSPFTNILDGDVNRQIDALWAYLMMGDSMPLPAGLKVPDSAYELEPEPGSPPKVVGVFMQGISPRVVAVGMPELVHYAFDVENSRLALVWRGRFFNARGTWEGRAGQAQLPPTEDVFELPPGPPFAILSSADAAWPQTKDRAPLLRARGRRFDKQQRPIFRYALNDIEIEESPVAALDGEQSVLIRRFRLHSPQPIQNLYHQGPDGRVPVVFQPDPAGGYRATYQERITW